ncbi:unnamed protein product, partial [Phaeothamnion confervicola]
VGVVPSAAAGAVKFGAGGSGRGASRATGGGRSTTAVTSTTTRRGTAAAAKGAAQGRCSRFELPHGEWEAGAVKGGWSPDADDFGVLSGHQASRGALATASPPDSSGSLTKGTAGVVDKVSASRARGVSSSSPVGSISGAGGGGGGGPGAAASGGGRCSITAARHGSVSSSALNGSRIKVHQARCLHLCCPVSYGPFPAIVLHGAGGVTGGGGGGGSSGGSVGACNAIKAPVRHQSYAGPLPSSIGVCDIADDGIYAPRAPKGGAPSSLAAATAEAAVAAAASSSTAAAMVAGASIRLPGIPDNVSVSDILRSVNLRSCGLVVLSRGGLLEDVSTPSWLELEGGLSGGRSCYGRGGGGGNGSANGSSDGGGGNRGGGRSLGAKPLGLVDGFLAAGAHTVLWRLWGDDGAAFADIVLLLRFYAELRRATLAGEKRPVAVALREAQFFVRTSSAEDLCVFVKGTEGMEAATKLALCDGLAALARDISSRSPAAAANNAVFGSPFYWAGFVCSGACAPVHSLKSLQLSQGGRGPGKASTAVASAAAAAVTTGVAAGEGKPHHSHRHHSHRRSSNDSGKTASPADRHRSGRGKEHRCHTEREEGNRTAHTEIGGGDDHVSNAGDGDGIGDGGSDNEDGSDDDGDGGRSIGGETMASETSSAGRSVASQSSKGTRGDHSHHRRHHHGRRHGGKSGASGGRINDDGDDDGASDDGGNRDGEGGDMTPMDRVSAAPKPALGAVLRLRRLVGRQDNDVGGTPEGTNSQKDRGIGGKGEPP